MKYSKKGIIGITLAAIMIASIFAVITLPVMSKPPTGDPQIVVNIVTPEDGDEFTYCDNFYVNAVIANNGSTDLEGINATIELPGNIELVDGETETKSVGLIVPHGVTDVWWEVHCDGTGISDITVNVTDKDGAYNIDTVTVKQVVTPPPPVLKVKIFQYPMGMVEECDVFGIKANITNIGSSNAYDVIAIIEWEPSLLANLVDGMPNSWTLGYMEPGDVHEVGWTMHCNGSGDVNITVDATAGCLDPDRILEDTVTVHQKEPANLTLVIIDPENNTKFCTKCDNTFVVTAEITNTGDAEAYGINALITATAGADSVNIAPPPTKSVPDLPPGGSATVSWDVTCNATGAATLNVTATGYCRWTGAELKPSDEVTIYQKDFIVEITSPANDSTFSSCQNFEVTAKLTNCKNEEISGFNVTFDFSDLGADLRYQTVYITHPPKAGWPTSKQMDYLAPGIYNVTFTESFCECCYAELKWYMHCEDTTDGEIIVNATKIDGTILPDEDSVYINQELKADLAAGIETFAGSLDDGTFITTAADAFAVCQNFTVVVPVTNWGEADAEDVSVTINVAGLATPSGTMTKDLGTIPGGESRKAIWELHCDGKGEVTISIPTKGDLTGIDENKGVQIDDDNKYLPCDKKVEQIPFTVEIIEPTTCTNFLEGQQWTVKTNITNGGDETLKDVSATIHWSGPATKVSGQPLTVSVGDLEPGESVHAPTWQMRCTGAGDVKLTVTAKSTEPVQHTIISNTVTVHQKRRADVNVEILSPAYYMDTTIATSEEFAVTARISNANNCVDATIYARVYIYPWDGAHVVSGPDPALPIVLAGGESQVVSWTLHCDKGDWPDDDWTRIKVKAWGTDSAGKDFSDYEYTHVYQYPAAHLEVDISAPDDGSKQALSSEFNITATITNTGEADVWEGKATLSVVPENSILLAEGGYTKDLGTLVGHGEDGSKTVTWTVQCEELGKSTITVTASGNDEFGLVFAKQTKYFEGETCFDGYVDIGAYIEGEMYIDGYFEGGVEVVGGFMDAELWLEDADIYVHGYFDGLVDGEFNGEIDGTVNATLNGWFCGTIGGGYYCDYYYGTYEGYVDGDFDGYIDTGNYGWFTGNVEGRFKGDIDGLFTGEMFGYIEIGGEISGSKDVCFEGEFNGNLSGWYEGYICGDVDADLNGTVYGYTYTGHYTGWYCDYYKGNIDGSFNGYVDGCFKGEIWDTTFSGYLYGGYVEVYGEVHGACYVEGYVYISAYVEGCFWMEGEMTEWTCTEDPGAPIYSGFIEPDSITVKQVTEEDLVEPFDDEIDVQAGWNFISVPKRQDSTKDTFGELLFGISFSTAYSYDPTTGWTLLTASSPVEVLDGYWINANSAGTITLSYLTGGQMVPPSKDLTSKAWNAIGFSSVTAKSASTTLKSVEGSWSTVIGWDETGQQYEGAIIYEVNDEALMYPGKGYWDWMTAGDTLSALSA